MAQCKHIPPGNHVKSVARERCPASKQAHSFQSTSGLGTEYGVRSRFLGDGIGFNPFAYLDRYYLQNLSRSILPHTRLKVCLRWPLPEKKHVEIVRKGRKVFAKNLMVCGLFWICPVCAARISMERACEVREAIRRQEERGGSVLMVTSTVPHYGFQPLSYVLGRVSEARRIQGRQRAFKELKKEFHIEGTIRALEVTYGANGWHVHLHELLFVGPGYRVFRKKLESRLLSHWQEACLRTGISSPNKRGIQVNGGEKTARYVNKWGFEMELTYSHVKKGHEGNLTPWDLLRQGKEDLFREYAEAFTGKHQLTWSNGLRALLEMPKEKSDYEIASEVEEFEELLMALPRPLWFRILKGNLREKFLKVGVEEGKEGLKRFLRNLVVEDRERYRPIEGVPF